MLADDVLAIKVDAGGRPWAYPGSTALSLRAEESQLAGRLIETSAAVEAGSSDKHQVLVAGVGRSVPLRAIYDLRRGVGRSEAIEIGRSPTISDLMGCTFIRYLNTRTRLTALLSAQAAIATHCELFSVNVSSGVPSEALAAKLAAHMAEVAVGHNHS